MKCKHCQSELSEGMNICPYCNTDLNELGSSNCIQSRMKISLNNKKYMIFGIIFILSLLSIFLIICFNSSGSVSGKIKASENIKEEIGALSTDVMNVPDESISGKDDDNVLATDVVNLPYKDTPKDEYKNIMKNWVTESGSYFVFNNLDSWYWYMSPDNLTDNYYKGYMEVLRGNEAIEALEIPYTRVLNMITNGKGEVRIDDIYYLKLYPTYLISNGVNKTTNISAGSFMKILFITIGENNAEAHNYSMGDTYYLQVK